MKNKILMMFILMLSFIGLSINANALGESAEENEANFSNLKTKFDSGMSTITVNDKETVTLYGKGACNGSTCTVEYAGQYSKFEDALKQYIKCSNGSNTISYKEGSSGKTGLYDLTNSQDGYSGTVYWSEDYEVSCTSSYGSNSNITLNNSDGTDIENPTNGGTSSNGGYDSSTTVKNEQTGVSTYFGILGVVALVSYVAMIFIKKFNLFKSI